MTLDEAKAKIEEVRTPEQAAEFKAWYLANHGSLWGLGYLTGYPEYWHGKLLREWMEVKHPVLEEREYSDLELFALGLAMANSEHADRLDLFFSGAML